MHGPDQSAPITAIDTSDIHSATKLGLTPEIATWQQCSAALMLVGEPYGIKGVNVWPHGKEAVKIPTSPVPTDGKANMGVGIIYGLVMSQLPSKDHYELTDTGLCLKIADLARAINAIAKDDPTLLTRLSELQSPVPVSAAVSA